MKIISGNPNLGDVGTDFDRLENVEFINTPERVDNLIGIVRALMMGFRITIGGLDFLLYGDDQSLYQVMYVFDDNSEIVGEQGVKIPWGHIKTLAYTATREELDVIIANVGFNIKNFNKQERRTEYINQSGRVESVHI